MLDELAFRRVLVRLEADVPIALDGQGAIPAGPGQPRRFELLDAVDDALRRRRHHEGEEVIDGFPVQRTVDVRQLENRLELGGKDELLAAISIVKGLDTKPIADQEYLLGPGVPDGDREHAAQIFDAARTEVLVEMD